MYAEILSSVVIKPAKQLHLSRAIQNALHNQNIDIWESSKSNLFSKSFAAENPLNILIVDDNPINQDMLQIALDKLGYQTKTAGNGVQALKFLEQEEFNVVLMDIQMPEMDGLCATKIVRETHAQQPHIIAVTANAMGIDREACFKVGMDDFISKPIDWGEMLKALKKAAEVLGTKATSC